MALTGSSGSINVGAQSFRVELFGAKGDGQTDDTAAIQSAINAAAAVGGGSVIFKVARYFTTGTLQVPTGVVLCGSVQGPFDVAGANPSTSSIAPTLLVTNTSDPFISLQGIGSGVTDLLFHYPNQVSSSASAPNVYPYTILVTNPGTKVVRSTVTNAYNFLDIEIGRSIALIATATNSPGYEFTNVIVAAAPGLGQAAIQLRSGGTNPPDVIINGGSVRGTWALGAFPTEAGTLTVVNMI